MKTDECVESLRDFVIRETEFQTIAAETIHDNGATHKSKQSKQSEKADRSCHSDLKSDKKLKFHHKVASAKCVTTVMQYGTVQNSRL